ncbi:kinase-like domain-containing protein [Fusarium tricinctum]|uniref:ethanolamine kinase n=2 Tax=Fusarium tricinctum species complex TaxID=679429 RepID=A0A8K0WDT9_9HYPO|nr:kinase-like domain-containing protein [Fusarium tricinctum]
MGIPFLDHAFDASDPFGSTVPLLPFLFPDHKPADGDLRIQPLAQGTTNGLFKVTNGSATADAVLVKVYGDGTDITIDRNKELRVHRLLADHNLSSCPLVRFANGHAYEFISGLVCSEDDMSKTEISRGVARELARWHATLSLVEVRSAQEILNHEPGVWATARKWLNAISKHPGQSKTEIEALHERFQYLADQLLPNDDILEPLVLGHGDLLCANIIVQSSADDIGATDVAEVRFIDYEHATYCPRAFELANHFAEWTGFECDYDLLPSRSARRAFVREYLEARADLSRRRQGAAAHLPGKTDVPTITDDDVETLMQQVDDYRGFPGFYWGLCALIQAETATGTIDFDYAGYAGKRFSEYDAWRKVHDGNVKSAEDMSLREKNWARP